MAANETPARRGAYLPVLPEGWEYKVTAFDTKGHQAEVEMETTFDGSWRIEFNKDGNRRYTHAVSLTEALAFLGKGIRAIVKAAHDEAEARKAREEVLNLLGEPVPKVATRPGHPDRIAVQ